METSNLWKAYHKDIRLFIKSKVKNDQIVDDLIQETFIKVHGNKNKLRDHSKIKSWLFTIARNIVYDYFKENKQTTDFINEQICEETYADHSEKDCLPELINRLPEKYRNPLLLSDVKGLKQKQIAEQLEIPLSTVKSQIQRARKMIIQGYMDCCDYKLNDKGKLVGETKGKENCKICR
ncbi:sigma-70 family RNA polymerase sigma factor [Aquimarina macrocephali]|uniref:sigma-70 family RNA polymerase sigma factor n=1 Tax=Aquimarina macrocephali TaxID=666563 RepID=UPI000464B90D|nr:sigma-70 family RNA polymerase sigma factor [Aquimarina macrocephali]